MEVPTTYFNVAKKIPEMFESIRSAGVPEKFARPFLTSLGYKSTNDMALIPLLKTLGFIDDNGVPTDIYRAYKDSSQSKKVLGQSIKKAYEKVFLANENAHTLSADKLKGIFSSLSGKSEAVAQKMASTFIALCSMADFENGDSVDVQTEAIKNSAETIVKDSPIPKQIDITGSKNNNPEFHYNIQIHLPATRDITVYNAIFKSIKEHLM